MTINNYNCWFPPTIVYSDCFLIFHRKNSKYPFGYLCELHTYWTLLSCPYFSVPIFFGRWFHSIDIQTVFVPFYGTKKMFICIFIGFKIRTNKPSTDSDSAQNFASFGAWFGFQYIIVDPVPSRVRLLEKAKLYYTLFLLAKLTY